VPERSLNLFSVNASAPGPSDYKISASVDSTFKHKLWSTNTEAFGNIQARFAPITTQEKYADEEPGPGQYKNEENWLLGKIITSKNVRTGKPRQFKTYSVDSTFKSGTDRTISNHLKLQSKLDKPGAGTYEEMRNISGRSLQGGSPNNFSKSVCPRTVGFSSTVSRSILNKDSGKYSQLVWFVLDTEFPAPYEKSGEITAIKQKTQFKFRNQT